MAGALSFRSEGSLASIWSVGAAEGSEFTREVLVPVAFVPLRGEQGWEEKEWEGY